MPTDTLNRRIAVEGLGAFVLHGDDASKHAIVLNSLAASDRPELVGLLLGEAYGADEAERLLTDVGDESLTTEETEEKARELVNHPWPDDTVISLMALDEEDPDPIQEITLELESPNKTLAGAMALTEGAFAYAPAYK